MTPIVGNPSPLIAFDIKFYLRRDATWKLEQSPGLDNEDGERGVERRGLPSRTRLVVK
jgi:hypothetical protein